MDRDDCYQLGHIVKPHGLTGELQAIFDVDQPEAYDNLESVLLEIKGQLVPFFIDSLRITENRTLLGLEGVDTVEDAEQYRGIKLYLPLDNLPPLESEEQFYYHEVLGFSVEDTQKGHIGTVTGVYDTGPQALLAIDHQGNEVLVPIVEPLVQKVDRSEKKLYVTLPEGLLDLYAD